MAVSPNEVAARGVIERFAGRTVSDEVCLSLIPSSGQCPSYRYEVKDGRLLLQGSDGVALCKGFYDFVRGQGAGIASWTGNRCDLPQPLPEGVQGALTSPVQHHYYMNVVTFGYTTAYWDWARWEQEIDWMALHGIDMPLALVGQEAISYRVFRKLGLTDEEIAAYFTGPAHLPWMRMGNISGHDGPLPMAWHTDQVALQHRILARMRELGMTPIVPGFSGFVPEAILRSIPDAKLTKTAWGGRFHNHMIDPSDPLFAKISRMFIQEWEAEFGKCSHYLVDSFNEMDLPFPPHGQAERYEMLARYGDEVYKAIESGSPGATWVMQGWMFGYQRYIWDERSLAALIERVPDDKMLLLDMAVDYNRHFWHNGNNYNMHKGFYGKQWVYSVIPNMGGKTGMTGHLEFYANGHLDALASPNRGNLAGIGMAPEGVENNEVIYELMTDAAWRSTAVNLKDWLAQYDLCRYGKETPALANYWQAMLGSVYGSFTDHPRYGWQQRPGGGTKGSINTNENLYAAADAFASCAEHYKDSPLYAIDLTELTVMAVGGHLETLMAAAEEATRQGNLKEATALDKEITALMLGIDRLLESHPTHSLKRWLDFARAHGETDELKDYYERNARRIVTIWGPPVDDYAAKIWSGLIRDYYLQRWLHYRKHGHAGLAEAEEKWVSEVRGVTPCEPYADPVAASLQLLAQAKTAVERTLRPATPEALAYWTADSLGTDWTTIDIAVPYNSLKAAKGVRLTADKTKGGTIEVQSVTFVLDGKQFATEVTDGPGATLSIHCTPPADAQGNNECRILLRARNINGSHGRIDLLTD